MTERSGSATPSVEMIRREAQARLRELEPALQEAEKLRDVLAVIDGPPAGKPHRTTGRSRPTPSGANKRQILEAIAAQPGITPREIATETGIKRTVVASTVNRLKRRGELCAQAAPGRRGGVALAAPS